MTEIIAPFVRELVAAPPRLPSPRVSRDDRPAGAAPAPVSRMRRWQRPLADLLGATVAVLGVQLIHPASESAALVVLVCWPALLAGTGCYAPRPVAEPAARRAGRVLRAGAILGLASWVAFPVVGTVAAPHVLAPLAFALTTIGLLVSAIPPRRRTRVVVAGDQEQVRLVIAELAPAKQYDVVAACICEPASDLGRVPVHLGVSGTVDVAAALRADAVLVLPGVAAPSAVLRRLQWQAAGSGIAFYVGTGLLDVSTSRISAVQGAGLDLLHVRSAPQSGPRRLAKVVLETALSSVALLALLPLLVAVAVMVRLDSPGPALFRQTRVGRDGQLFTMYKFRTMRVLAEAERDQLDEANECDGVLFKVRRDPRVTRPGVWLRRYSVDELPQLINVVLGDMSLVGPRPALPAEVEAYDLDPRRRLAVKPGLTGLWQVSGRSDLTWAESVRLDVRYVDNWSLTQDLSILRRTAGAVLRHRGAY